MTDDTPLLSLPLILPAQAQKHVTHNEALRLLDIIVQLAVIDRNRTAPPALPQEGDRHIIAGPATGPWQGQEGKVAAFWGGAWAVIAPRPGWQARILDEGLTVAFAEDGWQPADPLPETLPRLGIAATPDDTNRLSVNAPATLFNHAGAGHQVKLNKSAPADTASLLFQTGFSGRAEIGLAGSDAFSLKVSADGLSFSPVMTADPATGRASFARPLVLEGQPGDPANAPDGAVWHNAVTGQLGLRLGGQTLRLDRQADLPFQLPPAGELIQTTTGAGGGATGAIAGVAGRLDLFPFLPRADIAFDRLVVNCTTAVAGALARLALYEANSQGLPGTLLAETEDIDLSLTGPRHASLSFTLRQGRTVWLGLRHSSTATVSQWPTAGTPDLNGGTVPATTARKIIRRVIPWTTPLPAEWAYGAGEFSTNAGPAIWLRIA